MDQFEKDLGLIKSENIISITISLTQTKVKYYVIITLYDVIFRIWHFVKIMGLSISNHSRKRAEENIIAFTLLTVLIKG